MNPLYLPSAPPTIFFKSFNSSSRSSVYSSHSGNIHTSSIVRTTAHRRPVTDWLPQVGRQLEVKSRRGREKTSALSLYHIPLGTNALLGDSKREHCAVGS